MDRWGRDKTRHQTRRQRRIRTAQHSVGNSVGNSIYIITTAAMSFLQGGSECAAGANPLAQLAKRPDVDTSLQSSIRNGQQHGQQAGVAFGTQNHISQQNQAMMNKFADQSSTMAGPGGAFEFQPMAHELTKIQNHHHMQHMNANMNNQMASPSPEMTSMLDMQQPQRNSNWAADFKGGNSQMTQQPGSFNSSMHMQMNHRPMLAQGLPSQMMMMRNSSIQQQHQQQHQQPTNMEQQIDWEDSFKEIEQHVGDSQFEVNAEESLFDGDLNPVVDPMFSVTPSFNDKYHEEYHFEEKNEFLHNPNAYEIGCKLMEGGARLSEAALAFEAAVQEDPAHVDAWLKLGQVQIQNEKELSGITALENCLLVDNRNLTALMSLAISYVNEGYDNAAFKTFENWIETKYPDIVSKAWNENPNDLSDDRYSLNKRVTNLFLKAAQLSPSGVNVDADVQTGLGVLFYSMEEYDKTLDCFQAAIRCNPNDALSWNRLGASYANSNRPEQAIEAYSKALQLNPNFVRARYNLGVSFINMGMYKDAVEHLLTGLSMHEVESADGSGMKVSDSDQSSNLIETLKRAFLAMDRRDLLENVRPGMNVAEFRRNFSV